MGAATLAVDVAILMEKVAWSGRGEERERGAIVKLLSIDELNGRHLLQLVGGHNILPNPDFYFASCLEHATLCVSVYLIICVLWRH